MAYIPVRYLLTIPVRYLLHLSRLPAGELRSERLLDLTMAGAGARDARILTGTALTAIWTKGLPPHHARLLRRQDQGPGLHRPPRSSATVTR